MLERDGESNAEINSRFDEIISLEIGGSFPVYKKFDHARTELYKKLSMLSGNKLDIDTAESLDINSVSQRFIDLLPSLLSESGSSETFMDRILHIVCEDSQIRTDMIQ